MLISIVLLAMLVGFIPDRNEFTQRARMVLSESLASSSSLFLQAGDFASIRRNLEFVVDRNDEMLAASVTRNTDGSQVVMGEVPAKLTEAVLRSRITVPVLDQSGAIWGSVEIDFKSLGGETWIEKIQRSKLVFFAALVVFSFISFYLYLGKMLKQLNPSTAVPARVRSALDTIAESLLVLNRKHEIVLANVAFSTLAGRDPDQLVGVDVNTLKWSFVNEDDYDDKPTEPPWTVALNKDRASRNDMVWYEDPRSVRHKFLVNCSPIAGAKGKAGGVLVSLDDVTLLEQKENELLRSKEEAESANNAKSDFLSNMSHEIRTPMTSILGFTEILKRGYTRDEAAAQKYLATISRSGKHLLGLINDILDLSKVESGNLEVESIRCSPQTIVHDVIQVLGVKAQEKDLYLRESYTESLPEYIYSDPARLRQVVTNLVGNAIKFTETGGVEISLRLRRADDRQQLAIEVSDTGIGMTESQSASVFQAFVQADSTITRRFGGTGLGLSISRDLTNAMGGDIHISSKVGEGSKFTAIVDVGDISAEKILSPEELEVASRELEETELPEYYYAGARVLVVDDAEENRDLMSLILSQQSVEVDVAENGKSGLEQVLVGDYDLVLMDVQMPVMGGFESAGLMRENGVTLPIIALTANAMKGFEKEIELSGFSHYMTKPIDLDLLNRLIASLMHDKLSPVPEKPTGNGNENHATEIWQKSVSSKAVERHEYSEKIYSNLVQIKPQFQPIAESFVKRLAERLPEFDEAITSKDMKALAALAHWLKGSGGSVGFDVFTQPASELELAARNEDNSIISSRMFKIRDFAQRLDASIVAEENKHSLTLMPESTDSAVEPCENAATVITSSLPLSNPAFKSIVERFIPKLKDNVEKMQNCLESKDFLELASLAHWLKGSGGNVGFHGFIKPAASLEQASKLSDYEKAKLHLAEVASITDRVALELPSDNNVQKKSA